MFFILANPSPLYSPFPTFLSFNNSIPNSSSIYQSKPMEEPTRNPRWKTAKAQFYHKSRQYQLKLRKNLTPAEKVLWQVVRNKQLGGYKFRRQHIIDVFIVDFVCIRAKLIIEVDGRIHDFQKAYDEARTKFLNTQGFRVIRFRNEEVLYEIERVKVAIIEALEADALP